MDTRDKEIDSWIKERLNAEVPLSKSNKQAAWEQIRFAASQQPPISVLSPEIDFELTPVPVFTRELLLDRVRQWVGYFITQEATLQKARENSEHHYKARPNYSGGLMERSGAVQACERV